MSNFSLDVDSVGIPTNYFEKLFLQVQAWWSDNEDICLILTAAVLFPWTFLVSCSIGVSSACSFRIVIAVNCFMLFYLSPRLRVIKALLVTCTCQEMLRRFLSLLFRLSCYEAYMFRCWHRKFFYLPSLLDVLPRGLIRLLPQLWEEIRKWNIHQAVFIDTLC